MADISETIQETIEQSKENRMNGWVAILVSITATFMALCNIKDGNLVQAMSQAQAHSIDAWSFYQAKSTKQSLAANTVELLKIEHHTGSDSVIKKLEAKIVSYEKEKEAIKKQAEGYAKEYDDINVFDDQFDMTEAFLSIAIALFGVTALTQNKWLLYFASFLSFAGFVFGLTAFFEISIHLDFMSKILG